MNPFAEHSDNDLLLYINEAGKKLTGRWMLRMSLRELIERFEFSKTSDDVGAVMHDRNPDTYQTQMALRGKAK